MVEATAWILLGVALRQLAEPYGTWKRAAAVLVPWLREGRVGWRGQQLGQRRDEDPGNGSREFWWGTVPLGPLLESRTRCTTIDRHLGRAP